MHTALCDHLGIEFPIFAFTHCRDVVVAVSKAGGFGVLGAVGFTPEQLEIELNWIDENIGDHTYGVDIVIPNKYEGMDSNLSADELAQDAGRHGAPGAPRLRARRSSPTTACRSTAEDNESTLQLLGWTEATATPQVEVALKHPKMTLIANALGTPPADMIDHIHAEGRKVAALCGSPSAGAQARRRRRRHHHRPGRRGGRTLRRGRLDRAVAAGRQGGRARPRARRRRHRQRSADRRGAGTRRAGRLDRIAVADGRGGREHPGAAGRLRQGGQPRHRPQPLVHRQAGPHAAQRLDRSLGEPGQPEAARHAAAVHGVRNGGRRHAQVPERDASTSRSTRSARSSASSTRWRRPSAVIERWVQEYLEATDTLNELNEAASV